MKVLAVQHDIDWEDREANYARVRRLLAGAGTADLVVLPEMFATGFSMNPAHTAEAPDGPTPTFLGKLARAHAAYVLGGLVVREGDTCRNEALLAGPDGTVTGRYAKQRLFAPAGEPDVHVAGTGPAVFDHPPGLAPMVCYDLRFPVLFQDALRAGARVFAVIASWPAVRRNHWRILLRARAIETRSFVIGVNRCGRDPQNVYAGDSVILDPHGECLAEAGEGEEVIAADLNLGR